MISDTWFGTVVHCAVVVASAVLIRRATKNRAQAVVGGLLLGVLAGGFYALYDHKLGAFYAELVIEPVLGLGILSPDAEDVFGLLAGWIVPATLAYLTLGVVPRVRKPKFRFSLRALLLFFIFYAIALGFLAPYIRHRLLEQRIVAEVLRNGGTVNLWNGVVADVRLRGQVFDDAWLEKLKVLKDLRILDLSGSAVTDDGLKHLEALHQLQYVDVSDTAVTQAGVQRLRQSHPEAQITGGIQGQAGTRD